jgi:hypothetical protein
MTFEKCTNKHATEVRKRVENIRYVKRKTEITGEMFVFRFR